MERLKAELGKVARSTAGRDEGKHFVICGILDEDFVLIADGKFHKLASPKKKKIKHLQLHKETIKVLADKLKHGKKIFDSELYKALKIFNGDDTNDTENDADLVKKED